MAYKVCKEGLVEDEYHLLSNAQHIVQFMKTIMRLRGG